MADMTSMNVSLPAAMRAWVENRVKAGSYANASDYVRDLIRHDQEEHKDSVDEEAIAAIRQGLADFRAGRMKPAEDVFTRLEQKYQAR